MKSKTIFIALLSASTFVVGCNKDQSVSQQMDAAKTEAKEATQNMQEFTYAQKSEFLAQMQTQLVALNQDLDKLSASIERSSDSVKAEAKPKLQALRDQAALLKAKMNDARYVNESGWKEVKDGTRKTWDGLKDGVLQARQWASEKIAP